MKPCIISIGLLVLFWNTSLSCDCGYAGPFTQMTKNVEVVSLVKVKKYLSFKRINDVEMPTSMKAEILKVYKGKEIRKTVIIWGDNGNLCRPYLDTFKVGTSYVIAMNSCKGARGQQQEDDKDYFINACGCYWLTVNKTRQIVSGDIDGKKQAAKLKDVFGIVKRKH